MTDTGLKKILGLILRNKKNIGIILERFHADEVEKGMISIPQDIFNKDIKMIIMDKFSEHLNDYYFIFDNGAVFIDLDLNIKQLGRIKAKYMLVIEEFLFNEQYRSIKLSYKEDVKSEGNFIQNMAIKAAGLKGNYLETAVEMSKLDFIHIENDNVTIDFDLIDIIKKIPRSLKLIYTNCENGMLKLKWSYSE